MAAETNPDPKKPKRKKLSRTDRRPKAAEPYKRRTACISPRLDALVMAEAVRRNLPSASALIELAIVHEIDPDARPEPGEAAAREVRQLRAEMRHNQQQIQESVAVTLEVVMGFVRTYFAYTASPPREEQEALVAAASERTQRFLDAVGRCVADANLTLDRLPDVGANLPADPPQKNLAGGVGMSSGGN